MFICKETIYIYQKEKYGISDYMYWINNDRFRNRVALVKRCGHYRYTRGMPTHRFRQGHDYGSKILDGRTVGEYWSKVVLEVCGNKEGYKVIYMSLLFIMLMLYINLVTGV